MVLSPAMSIDVRQMARFGLAEENKILQVGSSTSLPGTRCRVLKLSVVSGLLRRVEKGQDAGVPKQPLKQWKHSEEGR
jgi:hypothetical protein